VRYLAGHYVIGSSIRFPGDNRDFGYSGFSVGVEQLSTVPDDAAVLLLLLLLLLLLWWKACREDGVTREQYDCITRRSGDNQINE
jgi:hypothetical protein